MTWQLVLSRAVLFTHHWCRYASWKFNFIYRMHWMRVNLTVSGTLIQHWHQYVLLRTVTATHLLTYTELSLQQPHKPLHHKPLHQWERKQGRWENLPMSPRVICYVLEERQERVWELMKWLYSGRNGRRDCVYVCVCWGELSDSLQIQVLILTYCGLGKSDTAEKNISLDVFSTFWQCVNLSCHDRWCFRICSEMA